MRNNSLPFFKGETIKSVLCDDVSNMGYGVFRINNVVVFAQGVIENEIVDLRIEEIKKNFAIANVIKIRKASEDRIIENIDYKSVTNNIKYQEFIYERQVKIKKHQMETLFKREVEIIASDNPWNYRNKSEFFYHNNKLNMYNSKNKLIPVTACPLTRKEINDLLEPMTEALNNNERANVSSVIFRYSEYEDKVMIILVSPQENKYHLKIAQEMVGYSNKVKSVILNTGKSNNYLFNEDEKVLYGEEYLIDTLLNKQFKITSKSFYQINHKQTEKLYQKAFDFAELTEKDCLADLYCGVGTIGIIASDYVKHVLGVEVVPEAVLAAKDNIALNEVNNYEIIEHDLNEDFSILEDIDVAIVDPPRSGLSHKMIDNLISSDINTIVYISCNPYTQVKDVEFFIKNDYTLEKIIAVDLFSYTQHVESIILLKRKK